MRSIRLCGIAALFTLASNLSVPARADYVNQSFAMVAPGEDSQEVAFPSWGPPGTVTVEAYNGNGAADGGLLAGQVRITFLGPSPAPVPLADQPWTAAYQTVAFNANLGLSPGQIQVSPGWTLVPNFANTAASDGTSTAYYLGTFSWGAQRTSSTAEPMSFLISGLGTNATVANFLAASTPLQTAPAGLAFESAMFGAMAVYTPTAPPNFGQGAVGGAEPAGFATSVGWLDTTPDGYVAGAQLPSPAPEPGTLALLLTALLTFGAFGCDRVRRLACESS